MKNQKLFRNYTSTLARALIKSKADRARAVEEMFTRKVIKNQAYMEILMPYLNNSSEEAIFEGNKVNEQHETMKL